MFGMPFRRTARELHAVVDIGTSSASIGILEVSDKKSVVLAAERAGMPIEKRTPEQFAARIGAAIEEASKKMAPFFAADKHVTPTISRVHVFLKAPWADSEIVFRRSRFDGDTKITQSHIDELSQEALKGKECILEAAVLRVEVNGYATSRAIGKIGKQLSLYAFVSSINVDIKNKVENYLRKQFPHAEFTWRSHARALLATVREHPKFSRNCVIVDIGNEGSSVLVIRDGMLETQQTFDTGAYSILERLNKASLPEETLGLLRLLEREQCSAEACDTLRNNIEKVEQELVREFGEPLAGLAVKTRLPPELLLFVHPDMLPWLLRFFSRIDFAQFTVPLQPFSASAFSVSDMDRWVTTQVMQTDISALLAAALVHIESHTDAPVV